MDVDLLEGDLTEWGLRWPDGRIDPVVATRERIERISTHVEPGHEIVARTVTRSAWRPIR